MPLRVRAAREMQAPPHEDLGRSVAGETARLGGSYRILASTVLGMVFRDDLEAAQARADALEQKLREVEAENSRLRAGDPEEATPHVARKRRVVVGALLLAALVLSVGLFVGGPVLLVALVFTVALTSTAICATRFAVIVGPGEIAVLSGRQRRLPDGRTVGYRIVTDGTVMRLPIVERVDRMDTRPMQIDVRVSQAYAKGGVPVVIEMEVLVGLSIDPRVVGNAVERFLGRARKEIARVASETIAGRVRMVAATLTPEEIRGDPERFAAIVSEELQPDLDKLGLEVDQLSLRDLQE